MGSPTPDQVEGWMGRGAVRMREGGPVGDDVPRHGALTEPRKWGGSGPACRHRSGRIPGQGNDQLGCLGSYHDGKPSNRRTLGSGGRTNEGMATDPGKGLRSLGRRSASSI
jgi:hypothetical protein